jgi:hypothetical protein
VTDPEVLEHIVRARPPWRRGPELTECGRAASACAVITREAFLAKVRAQGKQRAAVTTCMTCWSTADRHASWEENPIGCLSRDLERYAGWRWGHAPAEAAPLRDELLAVAALVRAHRNEFDALLIGLGQTVSLGDARHRRLSRRE